MITLENDLLEDLTAELSITDPLFNQAVIIPKIRAAMREVRRARNYPKHYTESAIVDDLENFYSNIRAIALYDYDKIGASGNASRSENGTSISFEDRSKLFSGIVPLARCN